MTDIQNVQTIRELKKLVIAHALTAGNTYAFHELFSSLKEFAPVGDDSQVNKILMQHVAYLLPDQATMDCAEFKSALDLIEKQDLEGDAIPGTLLEETAKNAVIRGKFAYAEDAYRLLGIKKEMVALYSQRGEQFLREGKTSHAAMSFLVASSLDQPVGPNFQYLGPQLHSTCLRQPKTCVTILPIEELIDAGIQYLLAHDALSQRLLSLASLEQKRAILGVLAQYRDEDIHLLVENLRKAADLFSAIRDGKPDDYSPIGPLLLNRPTGTDEAWQYLRELSYEHPLAALCVCIRRIKEKTKLVPILREGKSLIEFLLPPEMLSTV
ncbi:MAG: hypothetical protein C4520_11550 [Candidatus Abyssobacteria bacterium SURF_5]|uniref:Uncharacterized protein n=1 Tax=Abyssobacteria bacterium (strain SURF_5) TaxID=2093360 RepID=A0A3A4NQS3_ABYX5|nr:MAG: hypothetical protein C4520_11550 [Candidatus Abyssubacteria bacterium SURF_5]